MKLIREARLWVRPKSLKGRYYLYVITAVIITSGIALLPYLMLWSLYR